jgi:hypothetical protein
VLDNQPQAAAAQLMGCEAARLFAAAAQLPVTLTIAALATHGAVMFFDFTYRGGIGEFDTDGKIFLDGGARIGR